MKLIKLKPVILLAVLYAALPIFILFTNPEELPLPLLITPIVLIFIIFFATTFQAIKLIKPGMAAGKRRLVSVMLAALPTLIIILQSIQQLSVRDVAIVLVLWAILGWYLLRIDFA